VESIKKNYQEVLKDLNGCNLIAVSKSASIEQISFLYELGQRDFAENKVQDLELKSSELSKLDIAWHFIGNLQSNKVKKLLAIKNLESIHSVSKMSLVDELIKLQCDVKLFLQVNTSGEDQKSGFKEIAELEAALIKLVNAKKKIQGLMTIGAIRSNSFEDDAKSCFSKLNRIKEALRAEYFLNHQIELSMGMSQDYKIALDYQTDWVRIGSRIFL